MFYGRQIEFTAKFPILGFSMYSFEKNSDKKRLVVVVVRDGWPKPGKSAALGFFKSLISILECT